MGKIFKGALLGAVSALGAYYYKNPKELEKHKDLLKENTKNGIEKLTAIINEKTQELGSKVQEEQDVAKEKLEELTSSEKVEKLEENFVELGAKAEAVKEEVTTEVTEKVEDVKEVAEHVVEKAQEAEAPAIEKVEEVKETVVQATEPTFTEVEEVVGDVEETIVEHFEEKVEPTFEEIHKAVAPIIEKAEEVKEDVEEVVEEKPKTTLDSIVSLFASKEEEKKNK